MAWTGVDLVAAAALAMALFGALLLGALVSRAREDILGSPIGWRLVTAALALFALRGMARFVDLGSAAWVGHAFGILAATVLPLGLYLILRQCPAEEVEARG